VPAQARTPQPAHQTATAVPTARPRPTRRHPVPEYARVRAVLFSQDLFEADYNAPALLAAIVEAGAEAWIATTRSHDSAGLRHILAKAGVPERLLRRTAAVDLPHGNIWMRDYGPLMVAEKAARGPRLRLLDFRYESALQVNDDFPLAMTKRLGIPVTSVPMFLDGGNFLSNGSTCFTSSSGPLNDARAVWERQRDQLGCRRIVVFFNPPHEHLDMWAKIVNRHTVLVNTLDRHTLRAVKRLYGYIPQELRELASNLDRQAAQWSRYMDVKRVPMPMPYRGAFRTFTNAVLVNGTAILPAYKRYGWNYDDYPDAALEDYYEKTAARAYAKVGYRTRFINADPMIFNGGALHCVTTQVPALANVPLLTSSKGR